MKIRGRQVGETPASSQRPSVQALRGPEGTVPAWRGAGWLRRGSCWPGPWEPSKRVLGPGWGWLHGTDTSPGPLAPSGCSLACSDLGLRPDTLSASS